MADFDLIASTTRSGVAIDEIEFEVSGAPAARGYLLGRRFDAPQPVVIALHDERGDKASLLNDLEHLAGRGFLCLSIDSPITRRASADRDQLQAFESQRAIAETALGWLSNDPMVHDRRVALVGRGIGGEVAASLAATSERIRVVVAMGTLPDRSDFIDHSPHPLAAGIRQFNDDDEVARQVEAMRAHRLVDQFDASQHAHWLLQVPQDDDRLSERDHATLSLSIPGTVHVEYVAQARDLASVQSLRTRVDFISRLCG